MFNVASKILRGIWAIEPSVAQTYLPQINLVLNGKTAFENTDPKRLQAAIINPDQSISWSNSLSNSDAGSIALIPISGPIMKEDNCGDAGTATRAEQIKQADANPNISAIILKIDSPGGAVDGTQQLAEVIKATNKPVIAFVDGMMASAALWIGSAADEVIASTAQDIIGSIGTMISFADMRPAMEAQGIKFHEVYADKSTDKNGIFKAAMNGDYKPLKEQMLNPLNEVFISTVKANRQGKFDLEKENIFTGKTYMANDALKYGLVDSIGNMDYAIERAKELSKNTQSNLTTTAKTETMKIKSTYNNIIASLKAKFNVDATEETVMTEEYAEHLNAELGKTKVELETAVASVSQLTIDLSAAQTQLAEIVEANATNKATADAVIAGLQTQITELKKQPGADTTVAGKEKDKADDAKGFADPEADHNKFATSVGL